jgi:hypothetical protein
MKPANEPIAEWTANPSTEWVDDREPMPDEDYNDKK